MVSVKGALPDRALSIMIVDELLIGSDRFSQSVITVSSDFSAS
jgi:hypothetical protein